MGTRSDGRWLDSGARNIPRGRIVWHTDHPRVKVAMAGNYTLASISKIVSGGWRARMHGWMWTVTPDMASARFRVKETPVKWYKTLPEAKRSINAAYTALNNTSPR